jgi:glycosyltransferase involved in cell wall biosynthesis
VIEPGVELPAVLPQKADTPLVVLYAGRGGEQKRVWLIDRIAAHCYKEHWPVIFHFAGNPDADLSPEIIANSVMHGQISEPQRMRELYAESHVIILTSAYEGFPMFIKEGMAMGCIPVVTALPGNKTHLRQGENALLIEGVEKEDSVVAEGIAHLKTLLDDPDLRVRLSASAAAYAQAHFNKENFRDAYAQLLDR